MPRLHDDHSAGDYITSIGSRFKEAWDGFWDFALRDNVLEVAIGLIIAASFTKLVNSFVSDLLLPIISLLPFLRRNLDLKFLVLRRGPHYSDWGKDGYNTLEQARDDGALVMAYGSFLNQVVNFVAVGLALYSVAQLYTLLSDDVIIKKTVKCRYCRKRISSKAMRCVNCTSWQDGREDHMRG